MKWNILESQTRGHSIQRRIISPNTWREHTLILMSESYLDLSVMLASTVTSLSPSSSSAHRAASEARLQRRERSRHDQQYPPP